MADAHHSTNEHPEGKFTRLWVKAQPLVTSYIFASVRNPHDAEDLVQEVAAAALADLASYDSRRPFTAWVIGIAKFRVLNYFRSASRDKLVFDEVTLSSLADAHQAVEASASERRLALEDCLPLVQARARQALAMRYDEGLSVSDIAARMNTTNNAVSLLLHKVRKNLGDCIEKRLSAEGDAP